MNERNFDSRLKGNLEGNRALVETAGILRDTFRQSDIIARVRGDEFTVLVVEPSPGSDGIVIARLQEEIKACNYKQNNPFNLSISVGIAHYDPGNPCHIHELMERADKMMYEQKRAKKSQFK